ncbi:MAG: response regulator transcription factor [Chloroflexota bacterium]
MVLVGGSPLLQAGIAAALASHERLTCVAQEQDVHALAARAERLACDVVVLCTEAPHHDVPLLMNSLAPARVKVLVLTDNESRDELLAALQLGVNGYGIGRNIWPEDLCAAIVSLARWDPWLCPEATRQLLTATRVRSVPPTSLAGPVEARNGTLRNGTLSEREAEVLSLASTGAGEQDIADRLCLSRNTIKTYLRRICQKLDAESRAHAFRVAIERGLIPDRRGSTSESRLSWG